MKKKALSLLMVCALVLGMITPIPKVHAAVSTDHFMALVGTVTTVAGSVDGLNLSYQLQNPNTQGGQTVFLSIDSEKLQLAYKSDGAPAVLQSNMSTPLEGADDIWTADAALGRTDKPNSVAMYGTEKNGRLLLLVTYTYNNEKTIFGGKLNDIINVNFTFKTNEATGNPYTVDDLDASTIMFATPAQAISYNQAGTANANTPDSAYIYNAVSGGLKVDDTMAKPTITYPNSDVMNLNGVKLDGANKFVNVPVSIPDAGDDVTVATTATGYYTSDCADGTEITGDIAYTYGLQIKADGDTSARDLTDEEKAVISIDGNGVLTIKAGAPKAVVTIEATGSYTNTKNNVSTASGTYNVELCHGDAGEKKDNDPEPDNPPKPIGGDPDDPTDKNLKGVIVYQQTDTGRVQVVTSAETTPYEYAVAIPKSAPDTVVNFVAEEVDAFGDKMETAVGSWVGAGFPTGDGANPTFSSDANNGTGTMTVGTTATKGDYTLTYSTSETMKASVKVTVDDTAITWPTLSRNTMTYGETVSKLTINDDGSYIDSDGVEHNEASLFSWATPDATPNVATTNVVMKFDNGAGVTKTKNYAITVSKADLAIVLNSDAVIATGNSIQLPQHNTITFADDIVLENTSVQDENGKNLVVTDVTPTYNLTDDNNVLTKSPETGDVESITGNVISDNTATLDVAATGNANYKDASRSFSIKVIKPVLDATITFAGSPVFNQEITATVTENIDQENSIVADVGLTYQWGEIVTEDGEEKFKALTTGNTAASGNLDSANTNVAFTAGNYTSDPKVPAEATIKYTPVAGDVGKTLALQVTTPSGTTSYGYIHSVQNKMANPVARATWGTITGSVKSVTTTTVTVNGEKDAWFAIALKNAPVTAAEGETEEAGSDGHKWVESKNGADVEFTQDDAGNALMPNTEYTVFMKKEADGYDTATTSFDTATAKESITPQPNPDNPDNPIPPTITGVTVTAAIDETAGLKFGQTLTASVTVTDTVPHDPVITIDADQWEYKWYRVTPAEGENPETEEVIKTEAGVDYVGNTYTLAENDIDKVIRVKATTKDTCEYIAYANDDTSAAIAKADGPVITADGFGTTEASNATATDGSITIAAPADLTLGYEYRLKAAEGAEENEWADATIADGVLVGSIGAGTYEIRVKETTTTNASNIITQEVKSAGYNITGVVHSYNMRNGITYTLYKDGAEVDGHKDATLVEAVTDQPISTTAGDHDQTFTIAGVPDGTYTLEIKKDAHLRIVINNVVVNGGDVDLAGKVYKNDGDGTAFSALTMLCGDLNNSDDINDQDMNTVINPSNYNMAASAAANAATDLNGDGDVNDQDYNIVINPSQYNRGVGTDSTYNFVS